MAISLVTIVTVRQSWWFSDFWRCFPFLAMLDLVLIVALNRVVRRWTGWLAGCWHNAALHFLLLYITLAFVGIWMVFDA
jgi:hypothetical protein